MRLSRFARGDGMIASRACSRPIPLRCRFWGLRGTGLRPQGSSNEDGAFALCARGGDDRFQSVLQADPAPLRVWVGSAGPAFARREARTRMGAFALCAKGIGMIASRACSRPIPLRCKFWGLRGIRRFARREARTRMGAFALCAKGIRVIASSACSGPTPLRCGFFGGLRGTGSWSAPSEFRAGAVGGWRRSRSPRRWRPAVFRRGGCW